MFARLVTIHVKPGERETAFSIGDEANALYRKSDGFVDVYFLIMDEEKGEYGSFSVWKTREDADAAAARHRDWLMAERPGDLVRAPIVQIHEVYPPRPVDIA